MTRMLDDTTAILTLAQTQSAYGFRAPHEDGVGDAPAGMEFRLYAPGHPISDPMLANDYLDWHVGACDSNGVLTCFALQNLTHHYVWHQSEFDEIWQALHTSVTPSEMSSSVPNQPDSDSGENQSTGLPEPGANCYWAGGTSQVQFNVRSTSSSSSQLLGTISPNTSFITFEACASPGWVRVLYEGSFGWIYVSPGEFRIDAG